MYLVFRGSVDSEHTIVGKESLDAQFYNEKQIPRSRLSYDLIDKILEWYFEDKAVGTYRFRSYETSDVCPD